MTRMVSTLSLQKTQTYKDLVKLLFHIYRLKEELSRLSHKCNISHSILVLTLGKICRIKDEIILLKEKYDGYIISEEEVKENLNLLDKETLSTCRYIPLIFS